MNHILFVFAVSSVFAILLCGPVAAIAQESSTTIGGYGELHYNEPEGSTGGRLDFHRFVVYLNHEFNDWISFVSETEIEHTYVAGANTPGELSIEQAYLELRPWEHYGFRAGIVLPPVGIINLVHEPPTFHGVERPLFHNVIIPTTWREAGIGFFGAPRHNLHFQIYSVSSFMAEGLSAGSGLRGGRQKAANASTKDMGFTGRVDYIPVLGLSLGASFFTGGLTGGDESLGAAAATIIAGDVRFGTGNLQLRGEAAMISITDAERINTRFERNVADRMTGWYAEAAYNFMPHLAESSVQQLFVFGRYGMHNTQAETTGFDPVAAYDRTATTVGFTWLPTANVAFKIDYQLFDDARDSDATGQFNAGIGYAFF
ncbi:MAG: hypothetical protein JXA28_01905 [Bacteroidetes bacterium]|nr:hypothetical protein [Bacteroidota bacterium]